MTRKYAVYEFAVNRTMDNEYSVVRRTDGTFTGNIMFESLNSYIGTVNAYATVIIVRRVFFICNRCKCASDYHKRLFFDTTVVYACNSIKVP